MKVRYTRRAFHNRECILDYLEGRSRIGARNVLLKLEAAVALLSERPNAGVRNDIPDVRVLFVGRYPYKIFYRVKSTSLRFCTSDIYPGALWNQTERLQ